jgi:hypothetical protein
VVALAATLVLLVDSLEALIDIVGSGANTLLAALPFILAASLTLHKARLVRHAEGSADSHADVGAAGRSEQVVLAHTAVDQRVTDGTPSENREGAAAAEGSWVLPGVREVAWLVCAALVVLLYLAFAVVGEWVAITDAEKPPA